MSVSASGLQRLFACAAAAVLPGVARVTAAATCGNWRHEFLRLVPSLGRDAALLEVPEAFREVCALIDLEGLPLEKDSFATEVAFAYNARTGASRELGRNLNRAYGVLEPGEIPGTADVVGLLEDDGVYIPDWKGVDPTTPRARDNWQMRCLALAAARAYGRTRAVVELIHIPDDGSPPYRDRAEFDSLDLDGFEVELRELEERVEAERAKLAKGKRPAMTEGPHCRRCPALPMCPAKVTLAVAMGQGLEAVPLLTLENAPRVLARLEAVELLAKEMRRALEDFAVTTPFDMPDGERFGPVTTSREEIDPERGSALLAKLVDPLLALQAVEKKVTLTKSNLSLVIRERAKATGEKAAPLERRIMRALREGGAVRSKPSTSVRRHKASALAPFDAQAALEAQTAEEAAKPAN